MRKGKPWGNDQPWVARWSLVALVLLPLLLAGCAADENERGELTVVVTTSIWADVVDEIVGDDGVVTTLIPRGADAHDYQVSPQHVAMIMEADLVIANGLGLEEALEDVLVTASGDGANILRIAPELEPLTIGSNGLDPHVWFDPIRVADGAGLIAGRLLAVEPGIDWTSRAATYASELQTLDEEIETKLSGIEPADRKLVTNHEALGYFADRYGFEVVGVVIPGGSTLAQPSSAELSALVAAIMAEDVPAIFAEISSPTLLSEAVAAEAGDVAVVELHTESLGEPGTEAGTLVGMLRSNAERIADALS